MHVRMPYVLIKELTYLQSESMFQWQFSTLAGLPQFHSFNYTGWKHSAINDTGRFLRATWLFYQSTKCQSWPCVCLTLTPDKSGTVPSAQQSSSFKKFTHFKISFFLVIQKIVPSACRNQ